MEKFDLSADELLLIYLTLLARDDEEGSEYFVQWFRGGGQARLRDLFNSLKEKGIILKNYNPKTYVPGDIEFNKNFLKSWIKSSNQLGKELFNAYPSWMDVNGKLITLKNISNRFASLNEFFTFYGVQIGNNPEKHKEIMELVQWAKDHNKLGFSLLNFVISHQWESLKELRDNPELIDDAPNICIVDE